MGMMGAMTSNEDVETRTVMVDERPVCCRVLEAEAGKETSLSLTMPVLLLHGLGCSADAWGPTPRILAEAGIGQSSLCAGLPGYGNSPGPRGALGMTKWRIGRCG